MLLVGRGVDPETFVNMMDTTTSFEGSESLADLFVVVLHVAEHHRQLPRECAIHPLHFSNINLINKKSIESKVETVMEYLVKFYGDKSHRLMRSVAKQATTIQRTISVDCPFERRMTFSLYRLICFLIRSPHICPLLPSHRNESAQGL